MQHGCPNLCPYTSQNRIAGVANCNSQGTSDLSKVAFRNNHLRLTELLDLRGGGGPGLRGWVIQRHRQRWRGPGTR